jgi:hypothetical protein
MRGDAVADNAVVRPEWRRYRVAMKNDDLSSSKTGFVVTVTGREQRL